MGKRSLVVLAAGMGSRFGGIKQIEPVGPNGEILADYAVYDAVRYGFERIIFIIKREHLEIFKDKICKKYINKIEVCFAFQELNNIPSDVKIPEGRTKMWGTTHALLAAKPFIDGPFLMINADDYNGPDSFKLASEFFDKNELPNEYLTVNYPFKVTSSNNGKVKRGVCISEGDVVKNIIESEIEVKENENIARPLNGDEEFIIPNDQGVTVNFFGLKPSIISLLDADFNKFIHGNIDMSCECLMPDTIKRCIATGEVVMHSALSNAKWFGMTYHDDLEIVKNEISNLINDGVYPKDLWS